jgi:phosphate transport system substrate-binding protein
MSGQGTGQPPETMKRQTSNTPIYIAVAIVVVVILVVAVGFYAGWFKTSNSNSTGTNCAPPNGGSIKGAGSTLVYPLMFSWESTFGGGTAVNYAQVGSSTGITDITQKTVDFGASDAPLNAAQRAAAPGVLTLPESAGGVVPIYNVAGVPTLNFNGTVLVEIYQGTVNNWNSTPLQTLNPGVTLPNAPIQVVYRSDGSGTTFIWTSYLSLESSAWASSVGKGTQVNFPVGGGQAKNAGVAGYVQKTPDTIGYVDLNYALVGGIQFGKVLNPAGHFITASVNNTASALKDANPTLPAGNGDWYNVSVLNAPGAGDYPITSLTYVFVYQDLSGAYGSSYSQTQAETLVDFLFWAETVGQGYSAQLYYVPLPASIVSAAETTIGSLTFDGSTVPNSCGSTV